MGARLARLRGAAGRPAGHQPTPAAQAKASAKAAPAPGAEAAPATRTSPGSPSATSREGSSNPVGVRRVGHVVGAGPVVAARRQPAQRRRRSRQPAAAAPRPEPRPGSQQRVVTARARDVRRVRHLRLPRRTPDRRPSPTRSPSPNGWSPTSTRPAAGSATTPTWPRSTGARGAGSTSTRCWSPPSTWRAARPRSTDGLVTRCSAGRWCSSATTATSAELPASTDVRRPARDDLAARRLARDRPGPDGPDPRCPTAPRSTSAPPARRGPPTWSPPRSSGELGGPPWSASAATCGSPRRTAGRGRSACPSIPVPAPDERHRLDRPAAAGHVEHAGPALARARRDAATTCSTPAPAGRRRRCGAP